MSPKTNDNNLPKMIAGPLIMNVSVLLNSFTPPPPSLSIDGWLFLVDSDILQTERLMRQRAP